MGLRFNASEDEIDSYYLKLLRASYVNGAGFDVYSHKTMPTRYHFSHNDRIAPLYIVPHEGYALTDRAHNGSDHMNGVRSCASMHCMLSASDHVSVDPRI